jgi:hypothetical protein
MKFTQRIRTTLAGVTAGLLLTTGLSHAVDYTSWTGKRNIVLNTTAAGANIQGEVRNFPVLIRLTAAESTIVKAAKTGGADIRFSKSDSSTALPYQIESWDSTGAAIWVKVDTIKANNSSQFIRMYWGNSAANSESNASAVFDTANGHVAVWQMSGTGTENDVTGNALNAAATGTVPTPVGLIGKARSFSTIDNYLSVPGSVTGKLNFKATTDYTLSAWVYHTEVEASTGTGHGILNKGNDQWLLGVYGNDEPKYYDIMTRGNDGYNQAATSAAGNEITAQSGVGAWRHVVGTWKGSTAGGDTGRIYINGVQANATFFADIADSGAGRNLTYDVYIGVLGGSSITRPFFGRIDQVTASKVVRDSNWVKLAYQNQKPGNSLVNIGTYLAITAPAAPAAPTATLSTTTTGSATVTWTAPADNGGSVITGYKAYATDTTKSCTSNSATTLSCTITNLAVGTPTTFTVKAINAVGYSAASPASSPALTPVTGILLGDFSGRTNGLNPYIYRLSPAAAATTERLTMTIVDVHGKRVWSKSINPSKGEGAEVTWNGLNANGKKVSAGMYIVRVNIQAAGQSIQLDHKGVNLTR